MKLKVVCRKVYDYVRYDLKEIAFPSSLPDPPHIKRRRKLTWTETYYVRLLYLLFYIVSNFNVVMPCRLFVSVAVA